MLLPGRHSNESIYRYGAANGQEKVDEISGSGNHYTAPYWEYDPRLIRRWNQDPVVKEHESPYACFANNPIWFSDPDGADTTIMIDIVAKSIIEKRKGDPDYIPAGTKLKSVTNITLLVRNKEIVGGTNGVHFDIDVTKYESPVFGGMEPKYAKVINKDLKLVDGILYGSYSVETRLSDFEVLGQYLYSVFDFDWEIQDNIILVRQTVNFAYSIEKNAVVVNYDGSSFPEHTFETEIHSKEQAVEGSPESGTLEKDTHSVTLRQSSYNEAIKRKTFKTGDHKDEKTKASDF